MKIQPTLFQLLTKIKSVEFENGNKHSEFMRLFTHVLTPKDPLKFGSTFIQ